ncbi:MAG: hypothetical protein Q8P99_01255 [bacterium]|nr:hypothetical protein [bacterium]
MGFFSKREVPDSDSQDGEKGYIDTALEAGAARREKIGNRLKSIGRVVAKGADFVLGTPEAVGGAAEKAGKAVASAARKAWEGMGRAKDNLVEKAGRAKDKLVETYDSSKEATMAKASQLKEGTTTFVREKVGAPLERRLNAVYAIPDRIRTASLERGVRREDERAETEIQRRATSQESVSTEIQYLRDRIDALEQNLASVTEESLASQREALEMAQAKREAAEALRDKPAKFRRFNSEEVDDLELDEVA